MREWMCTALVAIVIVAGCASDRPETDATSVGPEVPYCDDGDCCSDGYVGTCYTGEPANSWFCLQPPDPAQVCDFVAGSGSQWVPCCSSGDPGGGGEACDECHWGGSGTCDDPWEDQLCDEVCMMQCSKGGHCSGGDSCCCEGPDYN